MPALTQTEYAKLRGVTPSAISQAVKTDRIHLNEDGLIETADADAVYFPRIINASAELTMDVKIETMSIKIKRGRPAAPLNYRMTTSALGGGDDPLLVRLYEVAKNELKRKKNANDGLAGHNQCPDGKTLSGRTGWIWQPERHRRPDLG